MGASIYICVYHIYIYYLNIFNFTCLLITYTNSNINLSIPILKTNLGFHSILNKIVIIIINYTRCRTCFIIFSFVIKK